MSLRQLRTRFPNRTLAFPFTAVLYPLLWFMIRDTGISAVSHPTTAELLAMLPRTLALTGGAVVVSLLVAAGVVRLLNLTSEADTLSGWKRLLFQPSNRALVTFTVISVALGAYIVAGSFVTLPQEVEMVVRPLGIILGWPLLVVYVGMVAVGNAFIGEPAFIVQAVVVGFGLALSTTWLFLLSGWLANVASAIPGASRLLTP